MFAIDWQVTWNEMLHGYDVVATFEGDLSHFHWKARPASDVPFEPTEELLRKWEKEARHALADHHLQLKRHREQRAEAEELRATMSRTHMPQSNEHKLRFVERPIIRPSAITDGAVTARLERILQELILITDVDDPDLGKWVWRDVPCVMDAPDIRDQHIENAGADIERTVVDQKLKGAQ